MGFETVERLIRSNYINFSIKSAIIISGGGRQNPDGTIDESVIYSQPPIVGGSLIDKDIDPEINIYKALQRFGIEKKKRNMLIKNFVPSYIKTDDMKLGTDTAEFIIKSYTNNNLAKLGMPFSKDPLDLNIEERQKLANLGHSVLEAGIISKNGFKSYNNYNHLEIIEQSFENIGKAYNMSESITQILKIENTPDLKEIFLQYNLDVSDIFRLRHLGCAKYFRKWINEVGENSNSSEVTEAYLAEIKSCKSVFNTTKGKIIKNTLLFGATAGLGAFIAGEIGALVGTATKPIVETSVDYGLGLIEEFTVNGIFSGKNAKIFIDNLKKEL